MGFDASIIQCLMITVGAERFAIPQENVSEVVRLTPEQATQLIGSRGPVEELYLKGGAVPLVRLSDVLGIERSFRDDDGQVKPDRRVRITDRRDPVPIIADDARSLDERKKKDRRVKRETGMLKVVVVKTKVRQFGLMVEEVHGTAGVAVRPVKRGSKLGKGYMGTALLGDGRTAYLLDPVGVAVRAGLA
jgi:two-component system, chemotaxis family, sensor kinase CheA